MVINKYKLNTNNEGYIVGFYAVLTDDYDYEGQMSQFPNVCEGWYKFQNNTFVEDAVKKAQIIAQREEEARQREKEAQRIPAQVTYTAMMTDTELPENGVE